VCWGGEMGRLPVIQNDAGPASVGRDHNTYGFSYWLAGGGNRGGCGPRAAGGFGHPPVTDNLTHPRFPPTVPPPLGLDAGQLVYRRNGQELSLLNGGKHRVVKDILR